MRPLILASGPPNSFLSTQGRVAARVQCVLGVARRLDHECCVWVGILVNRFAAKTANTDSLRQSCTSQFSYATGPHMMGGFNFQQARPKFVEMCFNVWHLLLIARCRDSMLRRGDKGHLKPVLGSHEGEEEGRHNSAGLVVVYWLCFCLLVSVLCSKKLIVIRLGFSFHGVRGRGPKKTTYKKRSCFFWPAHPFSPKKVH